MHVQRVTTSRNEVKPTCIKTPRKSFHISGNWLNFRIILSVWMQFQYHSSRIAFQDNLPKSYFLSKLKPIKSCCRLSHEHRANPDMDSKTRTQYLTQFISKNKIWCCLIVRPQISSINIYLEPQRRRRDPTNHCSWKWVPQDGAQPLKFSSIITNKGNISSTLSKTPSWMNLFRKNHKAHS